MNIIIVTIHLRLTRVHGTIIGSRRCEKGHLSNANIVHFFLLIHIHHHILIFVPIFLSTIRTICTPTSHHGIVIVLSQHGSIVGGVAEHKAEPFAAAKVVVIVVDRKRTLGRFVFSHVRGTKGGQGDPERHPYTVLRELMSIPQISGPVKDEIIPNSLRGFNQSVHQAEGKIIFARGLRHNAVGGGNDKCTIRRHGVGQALPHDPLRITKLFLSSLLLLLL
mmetsp:Transcript_22476/g.48952  ORF Transcript_22476/g.48952 Transcript_22476/m.48952 type:complete len:221 (-) Transcript_22476:1349-2011(-)